MKNTIATETMNYLGGGILKHVNVECVVFDMAADAELLLKWTY